MTNIATTSVGSAEVGPPPPFDPECAAALVSIGEFISPSLNPDGIPGARSMLAQFLPRPTDEALARNGAFTIDERSVPGPAGAPDISLLICRPASATGPVGAIYSIHGGGMVTGDNRTALDEVLDWAESLELAVISVEYRLAPETAHPGPVEDCYAGLLWVDANAEDLGIDPSQIVIAGASAGGGLAAAVALMTRDQDGPALAGQLLMCPMLDDRNNTVSARQMAGRGVWDQTSNATGWAALLGEPSGGPDVSPYASPARATDYSHLPPTFLDVGSAETFRDEIVTYASRLWQAGGIAELHVWPGGFHGYFGMAPHAQISQETLAARLAWLRRLLAP